MYFRNVSRRVLIPAALVAFVGAALFQSIGNAQKRAPFPKVTRVLTQELDDIEGREVRIEIVDFAPGAEAPGHRHPGHVFVYVAEGEIVSQLDDGPISTFKAGDTFYEPTNGLHAVTRNPSDSDTAKIVVFMIMDNDKPSLVFAR